MSTVEELVKRAKALVKATESEFRAYQLYGGDGECIDIDHLSELAQRLDAALVDHERAEIMAATR